jgi:hypothetical protein
MKDYRWIVLAAGSGLAAAFLLQAAKTDGLNILTGPQAFSNTTSLKPGQARKITVQDLPKPGDTPFHFAVVCTMTWFQKGLAKIRIIETTKQ